MGCASIQQEIVDFQRDCVIMHAMISIEDTNCERYHINPAHVVYVKERLVAEEIIYKILLSNGEVLMTKNAEGARSIIESLLKYK